MKIIIQLAVVVILGIGGSSALGFTTGVPITVSNLSWTTSAVPGASSACNSLNLDLTGDFANSTKFSQYGTLSCGTLGSYSVHGTGYIDVSSSLTFTVTVGLSSVWQCAVGLSSLAGSCTLTNAATGAQIGTVSLTPR